MLTEPGDFALVGHVGPSGLLEAVVAGLMPCEDPPAAESAQSLGGVKQPGSALSLADLVWNSAEAMGSAAELAAGLEAFEVESKLHFGAGFVALDAEARQALFEAVEGGATRAIWPVAPRDQWRGKPRADRDGARIAQRGRHVARCAPLIG